jgi:hypothetical protein
MKKFLILLILSSPAFSEPWTSKLSPRMREAFKAMARDDWKPQQAAELSPSEAKDLRQMWKSVQEASARTAPRANSLPHLKKSEQAPEPASSEAVRPGDSGP